MREYSWKSVCTHVSFADVMGAILLATLIVGVVVIVAGGRIDAPFLYRSGG